MATREHSSNYDDLDYDMEDTKRSTQHHNLDGITPNPSTSRIGQNVLVTENPYYGIDEPTELRNSMVHTNADTNNSQIVQCTENIYYGDI